MHSTIDFGNLKKNTCKYQINQIPNDKEKHKPENADQQEEKGSSQGRSH